MFTAEVDSNLGVGYDFLYLGIEGGRVTVKFNNIGGLDSHTVSGTSNVYVNDTEIHAVQVLFQSQSVDLLVDNHDRTLISSEWQKKILKNQIFLYLSLSLSVQLHLGPLFKLPK